VSTLAAIKDAFLPGGRISALRVWFAVATGPAVWFVHLAGAATLAPVQCRLGTTWYVNALTAICGIIIAWSMVIAWRMYAEGRAADAGHPSQALSFIGFVGLAWGGISLLVTVVEGIPNAVLSSCPR
jgi:hypothetical protein